MYCSEVKNLMTLTFSFLLQKVVPNYLPFSSFVVCDYFVSGFVICVLLHLSTCLLFDFNFRCIFSNNVQCSHSKLNS